MCSVWCSVLCNASRSLGFALIQFQFKPSLCVCAMLCPCLCQCSIRSVQIVCRHGPATARTLSALAWHTIRLRSIRRRPIAAPGHSGLHCFWPSPTCYGCCSLAVQSSLSARCLARSVRFVLCAATLHQQQQHQNRVIVVFGAWANSIRSLIDDETDHRQQQ